MRKRLFLTSAILLGLFFIAAGPARAARLYFDPGEKTVSQGAAFDVGLRLDTEGASTSGVDVVLDFDVSKVTVESVGFGSLYSSGVVRNKDNTTGRLEFSTYFNDLFSVYEGEGRLATIRFRAGSQNTTDVNFVCQSGGTADTNVLQFNDGDIVNCGALGNLRVTISASASPSPSPSSGDDGGGGVQPPGDTSSPDSPDRPTGLTATSGPGRGQVTLRWNKSSGATHYAIAFGERWLDFDYGAANVGDTDQFLVNGLKTGVPYYFVVAAVKNGASSGWSDGASAYAGQGAVSPSRQTVYTPATQEKGWEPPEPIKLEAEDEDEATQGAIFEPSPSPSPSATPKPYYEPPMPKKPWQKTDFWKKLGLILLILFLLWLLLGFLRRRKKQKTVKKKMEKNVSDLSGRKNTEAKSSSSSPASPPPPF